MNLLARKTPTYRSRLGSRPRVAHLAASFWAGLLMGALACTAQGLAADDHSDQASQTDTAHSKTLEKSVLNYPTTKRGDVVDDYHGTQVPDPYRWLEDPDSEETRQWVEAQNKVTFGYLDQIPQRKWLRERLTKLWNYERHGIPFKRGGRYFFRHNTGLQNQDVLFWSEEIHAEPTVLLDPNELSKGGTVSLTGWEVSHDGKHLAYGLSVSGSDWQEWRVRDVTTGRDLEDHLQWVKFSGASWSLDDQGFYYSRYDEPQENERLTGTNYFQKLYYHKVGQAQSSDVLVYERPDQKEWSFGGTVTEDGKYLVISVFMGSDRKNQIFYREQANAQGEIKELITGFDAEYSLLGNLGPVFYFHTDADAPRYRVIAVDIRQPQRDQWKTIVPEGKDLLDGASMVGGHLILTYLHDAHSLVRVASTEGREIREVELPGLGTVAGFGGEFKDPETYFSFTGFTTPLVIFKYNVADGKAEMVRQTKVDVDTSNYVTQQVFYPSTDGTPVPMFIVHRKDISMDGSNPTLLYGYGGFNISLTPNFSTSRALWLDMGGIYAMPNLRGGGEYGRAWHEGGMKQNKQQVFDDFIRAAEWLIEQKYTSPKKLAISGRSNGGLLVGACMTQRPELFGATLPGVGVMDMLRYHKFTIGWAWMGEFGSSDNADDFRSLLAYSPLHSIRQGRAYPPTLITTADHDDRVVPAHSYKFAAAMQTAQSGSNPILIRIETSAGHGAGTPTAKQIEELADTYGFLIQTLNMNVPR